MVSPYSPSFFPSGIQSHDEAGVINFELDLITRAGDRILEDYSLYIKQNLVGLGVKVRAFALNSLEFETYTDWDLKVDYNLDARKYSTPSLYQSYHSKTEAGLQRAGIQSNYTKWIGDVRTEIQANYSEWLNRDTGLDISELDAILERAEYTNDIVDKRYETDLFSQIYMDQLLYSLPLTQIKEEIAVQPGLSESNHFWPNTGLDLYRSRQINEIWDEEIRDETSELHLATTTKNGSILHPLLLTPENSALIRPLFSPLLDFDQEFKAHPSLAYQWLVEDWIGDNVSITDGHHQFFINRDHVFSDGHPVDANDIALTLQYYLQAEDDVFDIAIPHWYNQIHHWNVSTTAQINDTLNIFLSNTTLNDAEYLGELYALPSHLFNYTDPLSILHETLAGPYTIEQTANESSDSYFFTSREDFIYPNEFDTESIVGAFSSNFQTHFHNMMIFAPHLNSVNNPVFWTFGDNSSTTIKEKPLSQGIEELSYHYFLGHYPSNQPQLKTTETAFRNEEIDIYMSSKMGVENVLQLQEDGYTIVSGEGPWYTELIFNLENEHLKYRDIRYALSSIIDKEEMQQHNERYSHTVCSPISPLYNLVDVPDFIHRARDFIHMNAWVEDYCIPVDFGIARDLFRNLGYTVIDERYRQTSTPIERSITLSTLPTYLDINVVIIPISLFVTVIGKLVKHKRDIGR